MELVDLARNVRRGAQLLDKKLPGWRRVMRRHADDFDIANGQCCILGTLEHRMGKLRVAAEKRRKEEDNNYSAATRVLNLKGNKDVLHGFDVGPDCDSAEDYVTLQELWTAEFDPEGV